MNPLWVYMCSPAKAPSLLPPDTIPLGYLSVPAPSIQYHASNLDWRFVSYIILYVSMPFSQIIPSSPSPTESKRLFYISVSLLMSHIKGYRYHLSKFHIYVLVYCIGVFLLAPTYWCPETFPFIGESIQMYMDRKQKRKQRW